MYDVLDRIARMEYLEEFWERARYKALLANQKRPSCGFRVATVPTQARAVKGVYRRFRPIELAVTPLIPFEF